ncbi:MAG: nitrate reductase [Methylocapsa sp.]|nr:nitrate reductase [Methylocapsa sp.]
MTESFETAAENLEHTLPASTADTNLTATPAGGAVQDQLPWPAGQRLLMCAPEYFGVDYVINPWMENQIGKAVHALALEQWANLRRQLAREAEITLVGPRAGLPDMVFTANAGFVMGKRAVISRFSTIERQPEEKLFRAWFERHGFAIAPWPEDVPFEGAGDALLNRGQKLIWCGHGFRSGALAPRVLEDIFAVRTVGLRLADPRFYHLDTCFCPLPEGWLMYYPPAFDTRSQETIAGLVPEEKRIEVGERDALLFACNAVDLNGRVFMSGASEQCLSRLRVAGFEPVLAPLSEFIKAGGAAKCLTLKLNEI